LDKMVTFTVNQGHKVMAEISRPNPHRVNYFPAELDRTLNLLTRRELIELADGGYRFQVELIRRWFARSRIDSQNI